MVGSLPNGETTTVVFAGGGSGGHLYPALAVAHELRSRLDSVRLVFLGTNRSVEHRILENVNCEFVPQELTVNTSNATFRTGATAIAAAGSTDRVFYNRTVDADIGTLSLIDSSDELIIPVTGSLLIYTFAGTTGPSWKFEVQWSEIE